MAYRWLDVAASLGASQMRIDSGGPDELTDEIFEIIVDGYNELIPRARASGVEILVENHWGPTKFPENTKRLLEAVDGLGLLFDTDNWAPGTHGTAWEMCAPYASLTHSRHIRSIARATVRARIRRSICYKRFASCWTTATMAHGASNRCLPTATRKTPR